MTELKTKLKKLNEEIEGLLKQFTVETSIPINQINLFSYGGYSNVDLRVYSVKCHGEISE